MTRRAPFLLALLLVAGLAAESGAAPPRRPALGPCLEDADCPYLGADAIALCDRGRCTAYDEATALRWVASMAPGLDGLVATRDVDVAKAPWFHEGGHVALFVRSDWLDDESTGETTAKKRGAPATCEAFDFVARKNAFDESVLETDVDDHNRPAPAYGCRKLVTLGPRATMVDDGCVYPHGRIGLPESRYDGPEIRCLASYQILSEVDAKGLAYDGWSVSLSPVCEWTTVARPGCAPAECRTCAIALVDAGGIDSCGGTMIGRGGRSPRPEKRITADASVCGACLPDEHEALLPRMKRILSLRSFVGHTDVGLRFFRAKDDCEASLR